MPITFESIQDPYGIRSAGTVLGQALMQRNQEQLQNQRQLELEQRGLQNQLGLETRAEERDIRKQNRLLDAQKQRGGTLAETLKTVYDPQKPFVEKVGALSSYLSATGDEKSVAPLMQNLMKEKAANEEGQLTFDVLKNAQVPGLPETHVPGTPAAAYRTAANVNKPEFEKESEKLAAKRSDETADRVVKSYRNLKSNEGRLDQQLIAAKSGKLPTPLMVKTLEKFGFPLSALNNPLAEGYEKNVNENIKGVSDVFRGAIRVAEIEPFMRTIPTLMNSDKGKELIIKNQMLENEAKTAEYKAYKEILKENNNKLPARLDEQILERTESIRDEIAQRMKQNFEEVANIVPTQRLYDSKGQAYDIPTKLVPEAIEKNKLFYRPGK